MTLPSLVTILAPMKPTEHHRSAIEESLDRIVIAAVEAIACEPEIGTSCIEVPISIWSPDGPAVEVTVRFHPREIEGQAPDYLDDMVANRIASILDKARERGTL